MPSRCRRFGCLLLWFLLPLECAAGEYRTAEVESLKITIDSDWASHTAPGYVPVRFDITNLGEPRVVEIVGEGVRFGRRMRMGPSALHIRQALRMARGDRVRVTIPVPVFADSENIRFEIQEDGRILERFNYSGFQSATPAIGASALIVADPATPFGKLAATWPRPSTSTSTFFLSGPGGTTTGSTTHGGALDVVLEPARLPNSWLGYTSVRAVVIGAGEWAQLDEAQKGALLTWTACGGDLIVADGAAGALAGGGHRVPEQPPTPEARAYFFGRIHERTSADIAEKGLAGILAAAAKVQDGNWGLPANGARDWGVIGARGFRLPIPGVSGVPTRAYLSILIVFSLLIGPVNYWFLQRRRRQVLFVLTAPLVSAVFIVLLGGYVLAIEGFRVSARAETFTMLDQSRRQAVTRASMSLYAAGMTPGGGLNYPRDVAVYAIGPDGSGNRDSEVLDLTDTQRFASGVIHARAPANVEAISFRAARERVNFTRNAAGFAVVNGLGVPIQRLRYRSGGTTYVLSAPLPAGGTATLKPGPADSGAFVPSDLPLSSRFLHLADYQPEGSYLAVLERSPFWESGVRGFVEVGSFHLVLGWPDGQP